MIKEYEDKGFLESFFEDPETQERKINSKKGVIDSVNKRNPIQLNLKKLKLKFNEIEKKSQSKKVI